MKAIELKPDIYWVGAIDWAVRDFHGYVTPNGTTYNSYLIMDDEITLLDTVHYEFGGVAVDTIRPIVDPKKIKNIVVNHIENDHMGSLNRMMDIVPNATIYTTDRAKQGMTRFFDISQWNIKIVKTGDELKIGKHTLMFLETPMLHWPDSMMTYIKEAKVLISQDAFGQHLASASRFDDLYIKYNTEAQLEDAVIDYYANILMPFGKLIKAKVEQVQKLGLEIDIIAPDHGIVWRESPEKVINMYLDMANGKAKLRTTIIYDTMWHGTEYMAQPLMLGIKDEGVDCKVVKLRATPMSVAIKEFWKGRGVLIGSPTLNNEVFPSIAQLTTHLRGLRPKNRIAAAFGSYGWGGGAVKWLYEEFERMNLKTVEPGVQVQFRPKFEDDEKCYEFGREFARQLKEYHTQFE
jgi:anaerobic nitric oxide reductase flavorubredoxin